MRPSSADTSEPAWVKRKMLSTKNSTSWPWSRKYSATVRPDSPTRARAPGGSFIWPYTSAHLEPSTLPFPRVLVHAQFDHLVIEVVALAGALANAGEHRIAAMRLGDVVDQLHDQHGLADAGAAEQADLAALGVRREQIDDLDAGDQDLCLGRLIDKGRCRRMDRPLLRGLDRAASSTASPITFMMRPKVSSPTGTAIGSPVSTTSWPRTRPIGRIHGDGAHRALAEMLGDFEHEPVTLIVGLERVQDLGQVLGELHVDHGAHHLAHMALGALAFGDALLLLLWSRRPRGICVPYRCSLHLETRAPRRRK